MSTFIETLARKWSAEYWKEGNKLGVHGIVEAALREALANDCPIPDHATEHRLCFGCVKSLVAETREQALEEAEKVAKEYRCRHFGCPREADDIAARIAALRGTT